MNHTSTRDQTDASGYQLDADFYQTDGEIVVRCAQIADARRVCDYFVANRLHLMEWEPRRDPEFFTVAGWLQRLLKLHELHKMKLAYYLLIFDAKRDVMLGTISFNNLIRFPFHACHVGYSLAHDAQGKGIMTRALSMACQAMFEQHNLHRIMAAYMPHNQRSEQVLQRVGFMPEGHAKDYLLINGQWQDHNLMALINPNWQA
ncbi:ribosomal protein S5-alanine N-acetyltransferase [Vibrio misgurnus]|uniref:ribosomal protein S5-alanine N-acetyltransferase n=1 Tax=Vibrio misgurnus TaxID=2993714 RepID=UPI0023F74203|nr:ribosomal protein S5-alanine N-acetyltransferase [Vibrio sp. VCS]